MKKLAILLILLCTCLTTHAVFDKTLPADSSVWNAAAGEIRDNWEALEDIIGTPVSTWGDSFVEAITAIGSTEVTLLIDTAEPVAAGVTVNANTTLLFRQGGSLAIATGNTVIINGDVQAGLYKIFDLTGTGKVTWGSGSVKEIYPQWWGAVADSTGVADSGTNDLAAFDAMLDSLEDISGGTPFSGNVPKMVIPDGYYRMTTVWKIDKPFVEIECGRSTWFVGDTGIANNYIVNIHLPGAQPRYLRWTNLRSNGLTFKVTQCWFGEFEGIVNTEGAIDVPVLSLSPDGVSTDIYYCVFRNCSGGPLRFGDGSIGSINANQFIGGLYKSSTVKAFVIDDGLTNCHGNIFTGTEFFDGANNFCISDELGIAATGDIAKTGNEYNGIYIDEGAGEIEGYIGKINGNVADGAPQGIDTTNSETTPPYGGGYSPEWELSNWTHASRVVGGRSQGYLPIQTQNVCRDGCGVNGILDTVGTTAIWGGWDYAGTPTKVTTLDDSTIPSSSGCAIKCVLGANQVLQYNFGQAALRKIAAYGFVSVSFWAKEDSGGDAAGMTLITSGGNNGFGIGLTADGEWYRYNATFKIVNSITFAVMRWGVGGGESGTIYVTDLMVVPGRVPIPYTPHAQDVDGFNIRVQTSDATVTSLWSHTLPDNMSYFIEAHVIAKESDGSDRNAYIVRALVYRDGGIAILEAAFEATYLVESEAGCACIIDIDGSNDVRLRVTGVAAETWNWEAKIEIVAF